MTSVPLCWVEVLSAAALAGLLHVPAVAATFYVDNSCAVNGDGRSAKCGAGGPWNSLDAAQRCTGMAPGDVLEIRAGHGVYNEGGHASLALDAAACSGTPSAPIVIQNHAGEHVVIDGTADIKTSQWTPVGGGVYRCSAGTCGTSAKFPFTAWYDRGNGEERLNLIQSNQSCDQSLPAGYMRYARGQVCAHLSDHSNPSAARYFRIPAVAVGLQLHLSPGVRHLTIRKNPAGGSLTLRRFRDHVISAQSDVNVGIVIDGLDIGWVMDRCINMDTAQGTSAHGMIIRNNRIQYCGQEGIHIGMDTSSAGIQIVDNEIDHIQSEPVFERCGKQCQPSFSDDGAAIRWGPLTMSKAGAVRGNVIHDVGCGRTGRVTGINLENGSNNNVIENNYVYDMRCSIARNGGQAILISNSLTEGNTNTVIRNNRMWNVDDCVTFELNSRGNVVQSLHIVNNTCADPSNGGLLLKYSGGVSGTIDIANNVFSARHGILGKLIDVPEPLSAFVPPRHNAFYCVGCDVLVNWKGQRYTSPTIDRLGAGNVYGDPNIDLSGNPPSLRILSPAGTAYGKGVRLGAPFADFKGAMRPSAGAWDIGADTLSGTGNAQGVRPNGVRRLNGK